MVVYIFRVKKYYFFRVKKYYDKDFITGDTVSVFTTVLNFEHYVIILIYIIILIVIIIIILLLIIIAVAVSAL